MHSAWKALVFCLLFTAPLFGRTWTSAGGTFTIDATLVKVDGTAVVLKRDSDGREIRVELSKLSKADQAFVRGDNPPAATDFNGLIAQSKTGLQKRDLAAAKAALDAATPLASSATDKQRLQVAQDQYTKVVEVWETFQTTAPRLGVGGELEIGSSRCVVIEASASKLIVRAAGVNRRFQLADRAQIPANLVKAVVKSPMKANREGEAIMAAFDSVESGTSDRDLWAAAAKRKPVGESDLASGNIPNRPIDVAKPPEVPTRPTRPTFPNRPFGPNRPTRPTRPTPTEPTTPEVDPETVGSNDKKSEPPTGAKLVEMQKQVREIFESEFKTAKDAAAQAQLAQKLYTTGLQTLTDDSDAAFVLLDEASKMYSLGGKISDGLQTVETLEQHYNITDIVTRKASILSRFKPTGEAEARLYVDMAMKLMESAVSERKFEMLDKLGTAAAAAARITKDRTLIATVNQQVKQFKSLKEDLGDVVAAEVVLATSPDDPTANLTLGKHYSLELGNWDKGLPYLAKGSDTALADAAKQDMTSPTEASEQAAVGDEWWKLYEDPAHEAHNGALAARAKHWYEMALPNLSGLAKLKTQKRIENASSVAEDPSPTGGAVIGKVSVTDLQPTGAQGVKLDRDPLHRSVTVGRTDFEKSIWAQPSTSKGATRVVYPLARKYLSFSGSVGLSDRASRFGRGAIIFEIYADNRLVWTSAPLRGPGAKADFSVFVRNAKSLILVSKINDYYYYYPGAWLDPKLTPLSK